MLMTFELDIDSVNLNEHSISEIRRSKLIGYDCDSKVVQFSGRHACCIRQAAGPSVIDKDVHA